MAESRFKKRYLFIPLVFGVIFGLCNFLATLEPDPAKPPVFASWGNLDHGFYDLFLRMKPPVQQDPALVLLNIDDEAITRAGTYPWPRGLIAQGLEALTEFNAAYVVFDIEYLNQSPKSVDQAYLDVSLKTKFNNSFNDINSSVGDLMGAITQRAISMADIPSYSSQLEEQISQIQDQLYGDTRQVAVENDSYMGRAMRLFGKSFITLNMQDVVERNTPESLRELARTRFSYPDIEHLDRLWAKAHNLDFLVPIKEVSTMAAGAGATNVFRDNDGRLRRIRLLSNVDGKAYGQLAFRPYLDSVGNPRIIVESGSILLKDAVVKGKKKDIRIPLNEKGEMLINWPSGTFSETFLNPLPIGLRSNKDAPGTGHPSFYRLLEFKEDEQAMISMLSTLGNSAVWDLVPGKNPLRQLIEIWDECEAARNKALDTGAREDRTAFVEAKDYLYDTLGQLAGSELDAQVLDLVAQAKAAEKDTKQLALYAQLEDNFRKGYKETMDLISVQIQRRMDLRTLLGGTTCVVGWTATASTDFGVTPFDEKYANVGTHTSVLNTILQEAFLQDAPWWVSSFLAIGLALGLVFLIQRMKTGAQILVGIGATIGLFFGLFLFFVITGIYIEVMAPLLSIFLSFLVFTLTVFFIAEQDKNFLRKAFSTYLSNDVIEQMVKNPDLLKLGGQKKWISAMFTDVKGFSTISEKMDPENLVRLLNFYLSGMSDIILENRGTIDKYEGDAIISFFGAPIDNAEHAKCICTAAILMKRKEAELNQRFMAENLSPTPLLTRFGINTGDMVVGNMGTERKMDYTIMGNAVNLAARLEGVNKQYGSWILSTETTKNEAGDTFAWRRLDRVRVVGINQPLRLYELVDFKADLSQERSKLLAEFDAALDIFEERRWKNAKAAFESIIRAYPDDGPCRTYLKRCNEFMENPPASDWEGVFNLTEK